MRITKAFIKTLVENPKKVLETLSNDDISKLMLHANKKYADGQPVIDDNMYDMIKDYFENRDPQNPVLKVVGAPATKGKKEKLPYYMGSMDKIKTEETAINNFRIKHTSHAGFVWSDKLDGNSALLYITQNTVKLFSRGDGTMGQNISHVLPYIQGIPDIEKLQKAHTVFCVRGEIIIPKAKFEQNKDKGANARNMVAGLLNSKVPDPTLLKLAHFVAYALLEPTDTSMTDQFAILKRHGFEVVHHKKVPPTQLKVDKLSEFLVERRKVSPYELDGIIVCDNNYHPIEEGKNPTHAFAFKSSLNQEKAEVIVTNIEWNVSKDGYLIPVVEFEGVNLSGVIIRRATAFNAQFIKDNCLGPGSRIEIIRSGDVIPKIEGILSKSSSGRPQMPKGIGYEWTETGVDIKVTGQNETVDQKQIENFFSKIKVPGISTGTIAKFYQAGFKTIKDVIHMSKDDMLGVQGFAIKSAETAHRNMAERLSSVSCVELMDASNSFGRGFGSTRLKAIIKAIPQVIQDDKYTPSISELTVIEGISEVMATKFLDGLVQYRKFYKSLGIECIGANNKKNKAKEIVGRKDPQPSKTKAQAKLVEKLQGLTVVFTGFRDKSLQEEIEDAGGKVGTSVSKKTNILIAKELDGDSSKLKDAEAKGVRVMLLADFKKEFGL